MSTSDRFADDERLLHDPRLARQCLLFGAVGLLLAPLVVGFIPSAIGLHAGATHLRVRLGHRGMASIGLGASGLGALVSALSAIVWGAALLSILLQRSAIDQARQWPGTTPPPWQLVDLEGGVHGGDAAGKRAILFLDVCLPASPSSPLATTTLGRFAESRPEIHALSWCPECSEEEGRAYLGSTGSTLPLAVGLQTMPEPFSLMSAKPTLVVLDADGRIRHVHCGTYTLEDLAAVLTEPTPEEPRLIGRPKAPNRTPDPPPAGPTP